MDMSEPDRNTAASFRRKIDSLRKRKELSDAVPFSGGMDTLCPIVPEDVVVRISSSRKFFRQTFIHQRMILKVILKGKVDTLLDGEEFTMSSGDAMLFFPHQFHSTRMADPALDYEFVAVSFLEKNRNYTPLLKLKSRVFHMDRSDLENLLKLISAYNGLDQTTHSEAVNALVSILTHRLEHSGREAMPDKTADSGMFADICGYLRKNFRKDVSLKTLSSEFKISPVTVRRMFHRHYGGVTPGILLRKLRIQHACELLIRSGRSISEIADHCGFRDPFSFSRAFKNAMGVSPREYREKNKKAEMP